MGYAREYSHGRSQPPSQVTPASQLAAPLIAAVDPTSGLLAGVISRFAVNVVRRVQGKAEEHIGDRLWALIRQRLSAKDLARLERDPHQDDWPDRLRARVEVLLIEDPRFAEAAKQLLFGDGGFDEAIWQLPADDPSFANRERELQIIRQALERPFEGGSLRRTIRRALGRPRAEAAVVEIVGPPMIGKSELAVHAAHELADAYPDGCLVVDLGGPLGWPGRVTDGLIDLLRAQGTELTSIPETHELALKRYRSWFHDKRALVIIENATNAEQVRMFLPPGQNCGAIVTGRGPTLGLDREKTCTLRTFRYDVALTILRGLDRSPDRWDGRSGAAAIQKVLDWSGCHPAAIASVAAWINWPSMVGRSEADIAAELTKQPLDTTAASSMSRLVSALRRQYGPLGETSPDAARLLRLLGLLSVPYIDSELAAALTGTTREIAEAGLRELVDAGFLRLDGTRYRMAPFHQRFAEELAREIDTEAERTAALEKAFRHFLETDSTWTTPAAAAALDQIAEASRRRANWIAAVARAFAEGMYELAYRLALGCAAFCEAHGYLSAWEALARIGVQAASQLERDEARLEALARAELNLAVVLGSRHQNEGQTKFYVSSLNRIRALVRYGLASAERNDGETARTCFDTGTELVEAVRQHTSPDPKRTEVLLAEIAGLLEQLR